MRAENLYIGACADGRVALSGNFGHVDPAAFNRLSEGDRLRAIGQALVSAAAFRGKAFDAALAEGRAADSFISPRGEEGRGDGPTALDLLRAMRPAVARSKDAALRNTYNALLARFTRSKASDGAVPRARLFEPAPDRYSELQSRYDAARKGA